MSAILDKIPTMGIDALRKVIERCDQRIAAEVGTPAAFEAQKVKAAALDRLEQMTIPGKINSFLEEFPGGFSDPRQVSQEQEYKRAASAETRLRLGKASFRARLDAGDLASLAEDVKHLISMTNLIQGAIEKPKLIDAIFDPRNTAHYLNALYDCLHGEGSPSERLGRFGNALSEVRSDDRHNFAKWTYATYFLYFFDPDRNIFVKPTVIRKAMEIASEPFEYDSHPTQENYAKILRFAERVRSQIHILEPRDMIDVQSFIWHMAPTGKWAED